MARQYQPQKTPVAAPARRPQQAHGQAAARLRRKPPPSKESSVPAEAVNAPAEEGQNQSKENTLDGVNEGTPGASDQVDQVGRALEALRQHDVSSSAQTLLQSYHRLWVQHKSKHGTTSAIERHPFHEEVADMVLEAFQDEYLNAEKASKDIRSQINIIQSKPFEWHEELGELKLYAIFGKEAITVSFMKKLRELAALRRKAPRLDSSESINDLEEDGATLQPLPFAQAIALLLEAQAARLSGQHHKRGTSSQASWQPIDCRLAAQWATQRFSMVAPQPKSGRRKKAQSATPAPDLEDDRHDDALADNVGDNPPNGTPSPVAGEDHDHTRHEGAGRSPQSSHAPPDRDVNNGIGQQTREPLAQQLHQRDRAHFSNPEGQSCSTAERSIERGRGRNPIRDCQSEPSTPERPIEHGRRGASAHFCESDRSTLAPVEFAASPDLAFSPQSLVLSCRHTSRNTNNTTPCNLGKDNNTTPCNLGKDNTTPFTSDEDRDDFQLSRVEIDDSLPETTPVESTDMNRQKRRRDPTPQPAIASHGDGHVSRFKRARLDPPSTNLDSLTVARDFLRHFHRRPDTIQIWRDTNDGGSALVMLIVDDSGDSPSTSSSAFVLIPPQPQQREAQQEEHGEGVAAVQSRTFAKAACSSWLLATVNIFDGSAHMTAIELFSTSAELGKTASEYARSVLHKALPATFIEEFQQVPVTDYKTAALAQDTDVHEEDTQGFVRCVATAACLLTEEPSPDKISAWAWIGAMAAATACSTRTSEFVSLTELPREPTKVEPSNSWKTLDSRADLVALHNAVLTQPCLAGLALIQDQMEAVRNYSKHLALIRDCAQNALMDTLTPDTVNLAKLDEDICRYQNFLATLSRDDDPDTFSTMQAKLAAMEHTKRGSGRNDSKMLKAVVAWVDMSIGAADAARRQWLKEGKRLLQDCQQVALAAQQTVTAVEHIVSNMEKGIS